MKLVLLQHTRGFGNINSLVIIILNHKISSSANN